MAVISEKPQATQAEQAKDLKTKIVLFDDRVLSFGHSWNRAACVAVSVAVQTLSAIANKLDAIEKVEFEAGDPLEHGMPLEQVAALAQPRYDIYFDAKSKLVSQLISGLYTALRGIARQAPEAIELSDNRTKDRAFAEAKAAEKQELPKAKSRRRIVTARSLPS